jgi:hypothetical protein
MQSTEGKNEIKHCLGKIMRCKKTDKIILFCIIAVFNVYKLNTEL